MFEGMKIDWKVIRYLIKTRRISMWAKELIHGLQVDTLDVVNKLNAIRFLY